MEIGRNGEQQEGDIGKNKKGLSEVIRQPSAVLCKF